MKIPLLILTVISAGYGIPDTWEFSEGLYEINHCLAFDVYKDTQTGLKYFILQLTTLDSKCAGAEKIVYEDCVHGAWNGEATVGNYYGRCYKGKRYPNLCYLTKVNGLNWWELSYYDLYCNRVPVVGHAPYIPWLGGY